jgi:uncharacterized protein (DUF1697 family)
MTRYIAFLRAINVGRRTVRMDRLREVFEAAGYDDVATYIASGNVIFAAAEPDPHRLEREIERLLAEAFGFHVDTFVRTTQELAAIAAFRPFAAPQTGGPAGAAAPDGTADPAAENATLHIAFLPHAPSDEAAERLLTFRSDVDDFRVHGREVYWLCRTKTSESAFSGAVLEKALGMPATLRNANTVRKIAELYCGTPTTSSPGLLGERPAR